MELLAIGASALHKERVPRHALDPPLAHVDPKGAWSSYMVMLAPRRGVGVILIKAPRAIWSLQIPNGSCEMALSLESGRHLY